MRISDWSSDVCSSDLSRDRRHGARRRRTRPVRHAARGSRAIDSDETGISFGQQHLARPLLTPDEVRSLREDYQFLFFAGQRSIVAAKLKYYADRRSEEHTSELQSLMRLSYAVFCLKQKKYKADQLHKVSLSPAHRNA